MRIVSIINQKGGCGKTTSAINLAGIFARRGHRTLLVDMDPQSHCAAGLAIPEQRIDLDIGDAMLAAPARPVDRSRLLWRASRNLDLAPSRMKLAGLEAARGGIADKHDSERRLSAVLAQLTSAYDVCFVDCSPSIGLLTYNALAAATHILIPVETSFFALQGATKQVSTIRSLAKRVGGGGEYWLLPTLHDEGSVLSRDLLEELRRRFQGRVAPVAVRRDGALKEAASFGQSVIEYAPGSPGARDYSALADWLELRLGLRTVDSPQQEAITPPAELTPESTPEPAPPQPTIEQPAAPAPPAPVSIAQHVEPKLSQPAADVPPRPSSEAADYARAILLKRADEQLRRIMADREPAPPGEDRPAIITTPAARPSVPVAPAGATAAPAAAPQSGLRISAPRLEVPEPTTLSPRAEHLRNFFGVRQTRSGVLFVQPATIGGWVAISGDFNDWTPSEAVMRRNDDLGVFELCLNLPPGRWRYRLVVDGRWMTDPSNPRSEPNEYGEFNSIIDVAPVSGGPVTT